MPGEEKPTPQHQQQQDFIESKTKRMDRAPGAKPGRHTPKDNPDYWTKPTEAAALHQVMIGTGEPLLESKVLGNIAFTERDLTKVFLAQDTIPAGLKDINQKVRKSVDQAVKINKPVVFGKLRTLLISADLFRQLEEGTPHASFYDVSDDPTVQQIFQDQPISAEESAHSLNLLLRNVKKKYEKALGKNKTDPTLTAITPKIVTVAQRLLNSSTDTVSREVIELRSEFEDFTTLAGIQPHTFDRPLSQSEGKMLRTAYYKRLHTNLAFCYSMPNTLEYKDPSELKTRFTDKLNSTYHDQLVTFLTNLDNFVETVGYQDFFGGLRDFDNHSRGSLLFPKIYSVVYFINNETISQLPQTTQDLIYRIKNDRNIRLNLKEHISNEEWTVEEFDALGIDLDT